MKKVEQITKNELVFDYDKPKTSKQIESILKEYFQSVKRKNSIFTISFENQEFNLLVKNITYLGHPHPAFKKRIQLSNGWEEYLKKDDSLLFGVYSYQDTLLFVFFDKTNFANRTLNNSSAHVWTFDLLKGAETGFFQKIDSRGNELFVIREDKLKEFFKNRFIKKQTVITKEIELFETLRETLSKEKIWSGITCYSEMFKSNFRHRKQAEWGGFYFEFKFEKFLEDNPIFKETCNVIEDKSKYNNIDLDLTFNDKFLGDLKTHSEESGAVLGNDLVNFTRALEKYNKIWYVVVSHSSLKDSVKSYEVTRYWNELLGKSNLLSYGSRMKNTIILKNLSILEINSFNKKYVQIFNQGKNSNGNYREPKIKINKGVIDNFLIYESEI